MIHIPVLRTRRLSVQLRELTIGQALAVAAMPVGRPHAECTAFLRAAVETSSGIADPANWTVQERTHAVAWYMAATLDDGPDFAVGNGRYSNYLDGENDIALPVSDVPLGELEGDAWNLRHLTGAMAESIERIEGEIEGLQGRHHWLLGMMAAQLVRTGEEVPDPMQGEGAYDEFLIGRIRCFLAFPSSDFEVLVGLFEDGRDALHHLMRIEIGMYSLVVLPKEGGAPDSLPPATFPAYSAISEFARRLVGRADGLGVLDDAVREHAPS